jgi:hypothetical protein
MQNLKIHRERVRHFIDRVLDLRYAAKAPLEVVYT